MRSIILGAGEGTRLRPHTLDRPKCLVPLAGKPLLERQLEVQRAVGIEDVFVVTGYRADQVETLGVPTFHNAEYGSTNMVASLMTAASLFDGEADVLVTYSDILYEERVLRALLECEAEVSVAVNASWRQLWSQRMEDPLQDAETLKLDVEGNLVELGKRARTYDDIEGQYMGMIKFSARAAARVPEVYASLSRKELYDGKTFDNMYMTSFLQHWIDHVSPIHAVVVDGGWLEVDTTEDLDLYTRLHERDELGEYCRI